MKAEKFVTSLLVSEKLEKLGFRKSSLFGYYRDNSGDYIILESDINCEWEFICNAYIFEELFSELPSELAVNEETYIPIAAFDPGWQKVGKLEYGEEPIAILEIYKNSENVDSVMRYAYGGKMIAYRRDAKGQYINLLTFAETPSDCAAKMILSLIQENILDIV